MVKVCKDIFPPSEDNSEGGFYMDGRLDKSTDLVSRAVKTKDNYFVAIVFGDSGSGKSTLAAQICKKFDATFNHERMCQSENQFRKQLETLQRHQAICLDEAFESLSSLEAARRAQRLLVNLIQVVRQKNIFILLVLPNFFDLNKTLAIFGSKWAIRTYTNKGRKGFFRLWGPERKRELYIKGKKTFNHLAVKPNCSGRFTKFMPIDESAYRQMKLDNLNRMLNESTKDIIVRHNKGKSSRDDAIRKLKAEGRSVKEIAPLFNLSEVAVYQIISGVR